MSCEHVPASLALAPTADVPRQPVLRAYADHVAVQLKLSDAWLARQNAKAQGEQGQWKGEGQILKGGFI